MTYAAGSYSALTGVLAAVLFTAVPILTAGSVQRANAGRRLKEDGHLDAAFEALIPAVFLMLIASFIWGQLGGDVNECLATTSAIPAGVIFAGGAVASFLAIAAMLHTVRHRHRALASMAEGALVAVFVFGGEHLTLTVLDLNSRYAQPAGALLNALNAFVGLGIALLVVLLERWLLNFDEPSKDGRAGARIGTAACNQPPPRDYMPPGNATRTFMLWAATGLLLVPNLILFDAWGQQPASYFDAGGKATSIPPAVQFWLAFSLFTYLLAAAAFLFQAPRRQRRTSATSPERPLGVLQQVRQNHRRSGPSWSRLVRGSRRARNGRAR